jgi:hypothetical protein
MSSDLYTKAILTVIAACLGCIVWQQFTVIRSISLIEFHAPSRQAVVICDRFDDGGTCGDAVTVHGKVEVEDETGPFGSLRSLPLTVHVDNLPLLPGQLR